MYRIWFTKKITLIILSSSLLVIRNTRFTKQLGIMSLMTFHASIKNSIVSKMEISEGGKPWQIASIIFSTTLIQLLFLESL